ncbi:MAG: phage major capsid protein, partial [Steroidobacteraceae bacterium]|nr:phage major capsid protein [Steroidobacteraceae bacterium]MDW8259920.1 phage major capsid protein [Gammaproteobacteria bacterium]
MTDAVLAEVRRIGDSAKATYESLNRSVHELRTAVETKADTGTVQNLGTLVQELLTREEQIRTRLEAVATEQQEIAAALQQRAISKSAVYAHQDEQAEAQAMRRMVLSYHQIVSVHQDAVRQEITKADVNQYRAYTKAFSYSLRCGIENGVDSLPAEMVKDLMSGRDPAGGYFVPIAQSNRIMQIIRESSPIRQFATVETIGTNRYTVDVDEEDISYEWIGEGQAAGQTTVPETGEQQIMVHTIATRPRASLEVLEDSQRDIDSWLQAKIADRFARAEANAFLLGNGVRRPRGILTYPAWTNPGVYERYKIEQIPTGNATKVTADAIRKMPYELLEAYHGDARWVMHRKTVQSVIVLKDSTNQYLWQP